MSAELGPTTPDQPPPDQPPQGGTFDIALAGDVDLERQPELRGIVENFRSSTAASVSVDLAAVTFMDSTGLGMLSQLRGIALERHGRATLIAPPPPVSRILAIVGFDAAFDIVTG
jgi:anti-sigma B factor antagonist